jgi:hypothetical protein
MRKVKFIPVTPGGTPCFHLASKTEDEAWRKLLKDAEHMTYKTKANFIKRGYSVGKFQEQ